MNAVEYRALGRLMRYARAQKYTYYVTTVFGATDWSWSKDGSYAVIAEMSSRGWSVQLDNNRVHFFPASVQQLADVLVSLGLLPGVFSSRADCMYEDRYWEIQAVLDKTLGSDEEDGAGQGIVADVMLLAEQRDQARDALGRVRDLTTWDDGEQRDDISVDELLHALGEVSA